MERDRAPRELSGDWRRTVRSEKDDTVAACRRGQLCVHALAMQIRIRGDGASSAARDHAVLNVVLTMIVVWIDRTAERGQSHTQGHADRRLRSPKERPGFPAPDESQSVVPTHGVCTYRIRTYQRLGSRVAMSVCAAADAFARAATERSKHVDRALVQERHSAALRCR